MRFWFPGLCAILAGLALLKGDWFTALELTVLSALDLVLTLMDPRYFIDRRERLKRNANSDSGCE